MSNPTQNNLRTSFLKLIAAPAILIIFLLDIFVLWLYLYNPVDLIMSHPRYSYIHYATRQSISQGVSMGVSILIIISFFILAIRYLKKDRFFIWAPVFSIVAICFQQYCGTFYPQMSGGGGDKDGYCYKTMGWYNESRGINKYQRWRSKDPCTGQTDPNTIIWVIDSEWVLGKYDSIQTGH